ncbi:calcyphosin-2 [Clonorchis sinensis]|uniref:Calcyphosin-2 n=1 Tax=Clonorchis sinensis TaxID=79923 RepID=G7YTR2_CLOSI|nr:calcyphosin-2 [Clonorchis sinensis]
MSFTARLSVFNPSDLSACTHAPFRPEFSWKNSISSWSLRSYVGMAFLDDSTWMLNEKHRTGPSMSPIPFLPRAVHHCAYGRRNGYPYIPEVDIFPGATLFVRFQEATNAPEQLRHFLNHTKGVLRIRICTVDSEKRQRAIEAELRRQQIPRDMWIRVIAKLQVAHFPIEPELHLKLAKLQATWRNALRRRTRPVEAYANLYKHYRLEFNKNLCHPSGFIKGTVSTIDTDVASRAVLEQGLHWFQLPRLYPDDLEVVWRAHHATGGYTGPVHFSDYLHLVFGELPEPRRQLISEVFLKMDPHQFGYVKLTDLTRFYQEPRWASKEFGSRVVFSKNEFLNALGQLMSSDEYVDFSEFQAFYEGFSIALAGCPLDSLTDSDDMETYAAIFGPYGMAHKEETDSFERLVRGSWGV